jgi:hypothetical protein
MRFISMVITSHSSVAAVACFALYRAFTDDLDDPKAPRTSSGTIQEGWPSVAMISLASFGSTAPVTLTLVKPAM